LAVRPVKGQQFQASAQKANQPRQFAPQGASSACGLEFIRIEATVLVECLHGDAGYVRFVTG